MSKDEKLFRQCELSRQVGTGIERYVAYLPTQFAKVGKTVGIKFGEEWREGWTVNSAGPCVTIADVDAARESHKRFRWVLGEGED